ncbi:hypothetical protein DFJ73DRAFT_826776 [Zopfochytrium polystomum]|nr:hypothetical protein DFJ73DRAFT_826776 [Zopfochytrium polystomum]
MALPQQTAPISPTVDLTFGDILEQCLLDVIFEAHREDKQVRSVCQICQTYCRCYATKHGADIFGNPAVQNSQTVEKLKCHQCNRAYPSNRYAPHLENCMGLGRRAVRTVRKVAASASSSPALNDSDVDDIVEKKKRRKASPVKDQGGKRPRPVSQLATQEMGSTDSMTSSKPLGRPGTPTIASTSMRGGASPLVRQNVGGKTRPTSAGKTAMTGFGKVPRKQLVVNLGGADEEEEGLIG